MPFDHEHNLVTDSYINSGALWQGSNSKVENYDFLAAMTWFVKVLQPFLHVDVISHCADNGVVF